MFEQFSEVLVLLGVLFALLALLGLSLLAAHINYNRH
jgi:hypothetical protein